MQHPDEHHHRDGDADSFAAELRRTARLNERQDAEDAEVDRVAAAARAARAGLPDVVTDPAELDDERREAQAAHSAHLAETREQRAVERHVLGDSLDLALADEGFRRGTFTPVPEVVTRFRLHVMRSPAPTNLQQAVAAQDDDLLLAALDRLPVMADEGLRFDLLLHAMRYGAAPFAMARHRVAGMVRVETEERWTEPMLQALLPAELQQGAHTEPTRRGRALDVATRLPLAATQALPGTRWSVPGCAVLPDGTLVEDHRGVLADVTVEGEL